MDSIGSMIAIVICDRQTGMRSFSAKMKEWNADRCHLTGRRLYFSISYSLYIGQKVSKYWKIISDILTQMSFDYLATSLNRYYHVMNI